MCYRGGTLSRHAEQSRPEPYLWTTGLNLFGEKSLSVVGQRKQLVLSLPFPQSAVMGIEGVRCGC